MNVIGLTGNMGSGKDTVAAMLCMVGYKRVAFADQVRYEVQEAIETCDIYRPELREIESDLERSSVADVWAKPTSDHMRRILQFWGTEYRRASDPDYWVKSAESRMPVGRVVISDVRFPNEVAMIRRHGGVVWRVSRAVKLNGIKGHASEAGIDSLKADRVIDNSGTLYDLAQTILSV